MAKGRGDGQLREETMDFWIVKLKGLTYPWKDDIERADIVSKRKKRLTKLLKITRSFHTARNVIVYCGSEATRLLSVKKLKSDSRQFKIDTL